MTGSKFYPWLLVIMLSLLGISFPAGITQFSMVTAEMAEALNVSEQLVLLADTTRAVCLVIAMFLSGYVYHLLGLRRTMALGICFQVASQLLVPVAISAGNVPLFFLFKAMQGFNAMAFPLYISIITQWVEPRFHGFATAIFNGSFTAGAGIGAWLAGKVIPMFGWHSSFYVIGGMCLLFAMPTLLLVREKPEFSGREKKSRGKVRGVYRPIVRNVASWLLVIMLVANTWVSQAITVDLSVYAQSMGYTYGETGTLMLLISVVTVVSSILAGWVSDRCAAKSPQPVVARSLILAGGYVLSAAAALLLPAFAGKGFCCFQGYPAG